MNITTAIIVVILRMAVLESVKCTQYEPDVFDMELYKSVLNSDQCRLHINLLRSAPKLLQRFTGASAHIHHDVAIKEGTRYSGDFYNCLSIVEYINDTVVQGKYAEVTIVVEGTVGDSSLLEDRTRQMIMNNYERREHYRLYYGIGCAAKLPPKPKFPARNTTTITVGVCIPKPCLASQAIDTVLERGSGSLIVGDSRMVQTTYRLPNDKPFVTADYVFIVVFSLVILLSVMSTLYDIQSANVATGSPVYRTFSVCRNAHQLLAVTAGRDTVHCVDGLRALAMAFIIWLHCYDSMGSYDYTRAPLDFQQFFIPFARYGVDTFFLLGGIFNVYSTVSKYTKRSFVTNLPKHILSRLVRLYPVLCVMVLAQASVLNHIGDGPQPYKDHQVESCRASWWIVLLFIQNIVYVCGTDRYFECLNHSWYLAADMQFFIASILVLIWTFGKKSIAWTALSVAAILSLVFSTVLSFVYNFKFNFAGFRYEYNDYLITQYENPFTRACPYFIGMLVGYLLHCSKNQKQFLNTNKKIWIWILWSTTVIIFIVLFIAFTIWTKLEDQMVHNILNAYSMCLWSVAVSWIIVACHHGYGGALNWFLSLNQWKLVSRLSYSMYIVHLPIAHLIYDTNEINVDGAFRTSGRNLIVFQNFVCTFVGAVVVAFIVTLLVEIPILNLYKLTQVKKKHSKMKEQEPKMKEADITITPL